MYGYSNCKVSRVSIIVNREPSEADPIHRGIFYLQPGIAVWSKELVPYNNGDYRARVTRNTVEVIAKNRSIVKTVPHKDMAVVELERCNVQDGYVHRNNLLTDEASQLFWATALKAIEQAAKGEKPCLLDNSPFVKVDVKFAGQELIMLTSEWGLPYWVAVFTNDGECVPSQIQYPLSYAKWDPSNDLAQFDEGESS